MTTGSIGIGGNATSGNPYANGDTYAPGDNRIPFKLIKKPLKRTKPENLIGIGKVLKSKKKSKK